MSAPMVRTMMMLPLDSEGHGEIVVQMDLGGRSFEVRIEETPSEFKVRGMTWARGRSRLERGESHTLPSASFGKPKGEVA